MLVLTVVAAAATGLRLPLRVLGDSDQQSARASGSIGAPGHFWRGSFADQLEPAAWFLLLGEGQELQATRSGDRLLRQLERRQGPSPARAAAVPNVDLARTIAAGRPMGWT